MNSERIIINRTRGTVIAKTVEVADSSRKRAKGMMFRDSLPDDYAMLMVFQRSGSHKIWMMGMRFPLDLIFLDSGKRVIGIHENVKPVNHDPRTWKTYCAEKQARYIIESNPGTVKKTGTVLGDLLDF